MDESEPRASPQPSSAGEAPWRTLFEGSSPRAILGRLVESDPLGIRARCDQRLRSQALLLDGQRLYLRSIAHIARHGAGYRGSPPLDVWIAERIRKALSELLDEDAAATMARDLPTAVEDERMLLLAEVLGMEPEVLASGASAFNRAPFEVRSTFCALVLEGRSPADWAKENGTTAARAKGALRRALWILGVREELDLEGLLNAGGGGDDDES